MSKSKLANCSIWFYLCLYPMVFGPGGYLRLSHAKKFALFAFGTYMLITAVMLYLRDRGELQRKDRSPIRAIVVILIGFLVLSSVLSPSPLVSFLSDSGPIYHILYLFTFLYIRKYGEWSRKYAYGVGAAICIDTIIITLQIYDYDPLMLYPSGYSHKDSYDRFVGEFLGTCGNVDIMSVWLIVWFVICVCSALDEKDRKRAVFLLLCAGMACFDGGMVKTESFMVALAVVIILLPVIYVKSSDKFSLWLTTLCVCVPMYLLGSIVRSGCHGCFLGGITLLLVTISSVIVFYDNRTSIGLELDMDRFAKRWVVTVVLGSMVGIAFLYYYPFKNGFLWEIHEILNGNIQDSFGSNRIRIWRESVEVFKEHPTWGIGAGMFCKYVDILFQRTSASGIELSCQVADPHSVFLSLLLNYGWIGFFGFAGIAMLSCGYRHPTPKAALCRMAVIAFLCVEAFGSGDYFTGPLFWTMLGLSSVPKTK